MNRKSVKGIYSKPMDPHASDPVVENNDLPAMGNESPAAQPENSESMSMDDALNKYPENQKESKAMAPFSAELKDVANQTGKIQDQQQPKAAGGTNDSYIVLRMRVQNGTMTVIGSKRVEGPLLRTETIVPGGLTHESFVGDTRVAIGSIPDFGEQRSYPRPGTKEHFITELPSFDFNLRLPGEKVSLNDLPKLNVSLYRLKEALPDLKLSALPLQAQYSKEVRVVAQLKGINVSELKGDVKESVNKSFSNQ